MYKYVPLIIFCLALGCVHYAPTVPPTPKNTTPLPFDGMQHINTFLKHTPMSRSFWSCNFATNTTFCKLLNKVEQQEWGSPCVLTPYDQSLSVPVLFTPPLPKHTFSRTAQVRGYFILRQQKQLTTLCTTPKGTSALYVLEHVFAH